MASVTKSFKVKNGLEVTGGKTTAAASTSAYGSLSLPHGTAPSSPGNGDMWTTSAGLYVRIDGSTVGPLAASTGGGTWGSITGTLADQTDLLSALGLKAPLSSPTFTGTVTLPATTSLSAVSDTATAATHYFVETGSDGYIRPKTLANVKAEVVTTAAVNSAAATTVGTIASGTWQGTVIGPSYGGTGVNNGTNTVTLGGNFATSGAYATTLTVTGATNVTLPTTGTLINSAVAALNSLVTIDSTNTATHAIDIGTAATLSGSTKTINLGTGGVAGSTTTINIGSASGGTTTVNNNLTVGGDLVVNGTTTTVNSTVTTLDDPVLTLGGDTAPGSDDNKDRGIEFRYHNGSSAKVGFFGFDDSTGYFTFIPDATNTSEVFSGSQGDIQATNFRGALIGNASTASTAAAWTTPRTITLGGDLTGSVSIDGSANVTLTATVAADSVALGTDTTGSYIATIAGTANQVTVSGSGTESRAVTLSLPQSIHVDARPSFQALTLAQENNTGKVEFTGRGELAPVLTFVTANATPTTLDSWVTSSIWSADYQITMKHDVSDKMTSTTLRVMWDGTDVHYAEYGTIDGSAGAADAVLSATYSSSYVYVQVTSATAATDTLNVSGLATRLVRQT